jgi:hypothetical protein
VDGGLRTRGPWAGRPEGSQRNYGKLSNYERTHVHSSNFLPRYKIESKTACVCD